jgi:UDP-N-acetylmuramoyl-tripeptide--D-alanyl-D-alanine ligase
METITLRQLLDAVGGTLLGDFDHLDAQITAVDTDSRKMHEGSLFIPLEGERFDGHAFIGTALESGAVGCLTARERDSYLPGKFYVKVRSTQRALRDLARWYKDQFPIPFVCMTGSVGKTTTKDMVAAVLGEKYRVLKTDGNFNNDIGLPLTLLRLDHSHEICVLEMGMNHAGEIAYLSEIARPDVALITNVGDSHIENLGSREGIFQAKCEIFSHMKAGGTAILNGDDALLSTLRGKLPFDTKFVGAGEGLDYRAAELESDGETHLSCRITTPKTVFQACIPALGEHMIYPALMAAAVGELYGMTGDEIARGIQNFLPTKMRMNVLRLPGDVVVLNDAYNANPQSMRAAAAVLGDAKGRRKVAVVGDMLELGDGSNLFHRAVGHSFAELGADRLIAVGSLAQYLAEGAREGGMTDVSHFQEQSEAMPAILAELRAGTTILVKASRAMHFEKIVEALTNPAEQKGSSNRRTT